MKNQAEILINSGINSWISYNMEQRYFVCFACQEFMADNTLISGKK